MAIDGRRLDQAYAHLVAGVRKALIAVEAQGFRRSHICEALKPSGDGEARRAFETQLAVGREVRAHLQLAAAALGRESPERRGPITELIAAEYDGVAPEDILEEAERRRAAHDLTISMAGARPEDFVQDPEED